MKQDTHPEYKDVVFHDVSTGKKFLGRSAAKTIDTTEFEGQTYPCYKVSISSSSHPFYTGDKTFVDAEGRVDKFKKRYAQKAVSAQPEAAMTSVEAARKEIAEKAKKKVADAKAADAKAKSRKGATA